MKKLSLLIIPLFMVFLAACGDSQEAQDVYQKAMEAGEKLESAEMDMKVSQTMEGDPEMGEMVMDMDMQASIVMDPLAMHQTGTMNMDVGGMPLDTEIETYLTDEAMYMFESMSQTWIKMDASMTPAELTNMEQDPTEQLAMLESFMDDVDFSEEDGMYVFKFAGEGDKIKEFTQQYVEEYMGTETFAEAGVEMNEVLDSMTIHSIDYEILIDKKTYDTKSVTTNLDLEVAVEEEDTMRIKQEMMMEYTGINSVDSIEVPQEVIDAAQDM